MFQVAKWKGKVTFAFYLPGQAVKIKPGISGNAIFSVWKFSKSISENSLTFP